MMILLFLSTCVSFIRYGKEGREKAICFQILSSVFFSFLKAWSFKVVSYVYESFPTCFFTISFHQLPLLPFSSTYELLCCPCLFLYFSLFYFFHLLKHRYGLFEIFFFMLFLRYSFSGLHSIANTINIFAI